MTNQKTKLFTLLTIILLTIMFSGMVNATTIDDTNNTIVSDNSQLTNTQVASPETYEQDYNKNVEEKTENIEKDSDETLIKERNINKVSNPTNTKTENEEKYNTSITLNGNFEPVMDCSVGIPLTINGQFTAPGSPTLENFPIDIYVNNLMSTEKVCTVYTNENGVFEFTYTPTKDKTHFVQAKYEGNTNYTSCETKKEALFAYYNMTLTLNELEPQLQGNEIIVRGHMKVPGLDGDDTYPITLYENGESVGSYDYITADADFEIKYTPSSHGNKTLVARFSGDQNFLEAVSNEINVIICAHRTFLRLDELEKSYIAQQPISISGYFQDDTHYFKGFPIDLYINDEKVDTKVTDVTDISELGVLAFTYTPLEAGNYTARLEYAGDDEYLYLPVKSEIQSFRVAYGTSITLDEVKWDQVLSKPVPISGQVTHTGTSNNEGFPINIYINDERIDRVFTGETGRFSSEYTPSTIDEYTLWAELEGNDEYLPSVSNNQTFYVFKTDDEHYKTAITLEEIADKIPISTINISGQITSSPSYNNMMAFPINIYVNDNNVTTLYPGETGRFEYEYNFNKSGNYTIKAGYVGNDYFLACSTNQTVRVMDDVVLVINKSVDEVKLDDNITIYGNLTLPDKTEVYNGFAPYYVACYINDELKGNIEVNRNGTFNYSLIAQNLGENSIKVVFEGYNDYLNASSNIISFNLTYPTIIEMDNITEPCFISEDMTIKASIGPKHPFIPLEGLPIDIYINDMNVSQIKTNETGEISYTFAPIYYNNTIRLEFAGNDTYLPANITKTFNAYYNTSIMLDEFDKPYVIGSNMTVSGRITHTSSSIVRFVLDYYVNGIKQEDKRIISGENGYFEFNPELTVPGEYNISVGRSGVDEYLQCMTDNQTLKVRIKTMIDYTPLATYDSIHSAVIVTDDNGTKLIKEIPLDFYVDGEKVSQIMTVDSKVLMYSYNLNYGIYETYWKFEGDDTYAPSTSEIHNVSIKALTGITLENLTDTYTTSKPIIIKGKVNSSLNTTYDFPINIYANNTKMGSIIASPTGDYEYQLNITAAGNYGIMTRYEGNYTNMACQSFTQTINVYRNITIKLDEMDEILIQKPIKFEGQANSNDNSTTDGINMDVYIDNRKVGNVTVSNGRFEYPYTPTISGNHTIQLRYVGNRTDLESSSDVLKFNVVYNTSIMLNDINDTCIVGTPITIEGYVVCDSPSLSGFPVDIIVNNQSVGRDFTGENGYFECSFTPILPGNYTVYAEYNGGNRYLSSISDNKTVVVNRNTTLTLDNLNDSYIVGNPIEITGHITSTGEYSYYGFPIDIIINDEVVNRQFTPESGFIHYDFVPNQPGKYTIKAVYSGGPNYLPSNDVQTFNAYYNTSIKLEEATGSYALLTPVTIEGKIDSTEPYSVGVFAIDIYVNGKNVDRVYTTSEGHFWSTFTPTKIGNNTVYAEFTGGKEHIASTSNTIIYDIKYGTYLTVYKIGNTNVSSPVKIIVDVSANGSDDTEGLPVDLFVNGEKVTQQVTDVYGMIYYNYTPTIAGDYMVSAEYAGNNEFLPATGNNVSFIASGNTTLKLNSIKNAKYDETINITGKLLDQTGKPLTDTIQLRINDKVVTVKTNKNGAFTYKYDITKMDDLNVMVEYMGNDYYHTSNDSIVIKVNKQDSIVVLNNISAVKSGTPVAISGQLIDGNNNGFYGTVKLLINNGRATVKTDKEGYFTYNYTLNRAGITNISAWYLESAKYKASENSTITVDVDQLDTELILDKLSSVKVGENITISGKLLDENGDAVVGTIKLLINNGRATVKTDENGIFSYEYTTTKVGEMNIAASYLGNNRYNVTNATTSVEFIAVDTKISLDIISSTKKGDVITISGKVVDENDKAIANAGVILNINGAQKTLRTDANGVYAFNYTVSKAGTNNVTASVIATNKYGASNVTMTVDVAKLGTKIKINSIKSAVRNTNVDITGQLCDENGKGIYGTVKLLINNGRATVKTDNQGYFTYTHNATRVGTNNVTASYLESNNYKQTQSTSTFTITKA